MPADQLRLAELLDQALRHNPDVLVAEAKLRSAEAELNRVRLSVTRNVVGLTEAIQTQTYVVKLGRESVARMKERVKRIRELYKANEVSAQEVDATDESLRVAQESLLAAEGKLSEFNAQLPYLIGRSAPVTKSSGGAAATSFGAAMEGAGMLFATPPTIAKRDAENQTTSSGRAVTFWEVPACTASPAAARLRAAMDVPTSLDFRDTPLGDVLEYLKDLHGINVVMDTVSMNNAVAMKNEPLSPITLRLRDVPLGAGLQAIEDVDPQIRFVVRDYGMLVIHRDAKLDGAVPIRDFWKGRLDPTTGLIAVPVSPPSTEGSPSVAKPAPNSTPAPQYVPPPTRR